MEKLMEVREDVFALTTEAYGVASIAPMSLKRCRELIKVLMDKITTVSDELQAISNPSAEQLEKAKLQKYMGDYLVTLAHTNFEHNVAHNLYKGLLELRRLLYRLLCLLGLSIGLVSVAVTATTARISDIFNAPLAFVLIVWTIYLLVHLGIRIKGFTRLEDEFLRLEKEAEAT